MSIFNEGKYHRINFDINFKDINIKLDDVKYLETINDSKRFSFAYKYGNDSKIDHAYCFLNLPVHIKQGMQQVIFNKVLEAGLKDKLNNDQGV